MLWCNLRVPKSGSLARTGMREQLLVPRSPLGLALAASVETLSVHAAKLTTTLDAHDFGACYLETAGKKTFLAG